MIQLIYSRNNKNRKLPCCVFRSGNFAPGAKLLKVLAELPRLRNLSIGFPDKEEMYDEYHETDIDFQIFDKGFFRRSYDGKIHPDPAIYLAHFRNLHKLSLFSVASVMGDPQVWRIALLNIWLNSPELRVINLSKGHDPSTISLGKENAWGLMLDWISNNYQQQTGRTLKLDRLVLDGYFEFPKEAATRGAIIVADSTQSQTTEQLLVQFGLSTEQFATTHSSYGPKSPYAYLHSVSSKKIETLRLQISAEPHAQHEPFAYLSPRQAGWDWLLLQRKGKYCEETILVCAGQ